MSKFQPPNVPFVEAAHRGGKQRPTAIELRISFTTSDRKAALGIANYLHTRNAPLQSYHYILDEAETYRCVPTNRIALEHTHNLKGLIRVNICAEPVENSILWLDENHSAVYSRTVDLVAQLVLAYKIKLRELDEYTFAKWERHRWRHRGGLIVRVAGAWPSNKFLVDVENRCLILKQEKR